MSLRSGTIFNQYRIERLIGIGGMGEVYLAEESTLGRKVAVKVLKQELTSDPKFVERFRNEARVLGRLNHPNIVGLLTFFEQAGSYYLVMQYASGITLAELIRKTGPIPAQRAIRIFLQIAQALTIAHNEGIVHRDIKPSNIMIDTEDNDHVMVMDFGIARMMANQHVTGTGTQMGTPCYMSPEQVLGQKDIGPLSDVYSSGVVLYEMLAGAPPYNLNSESLYSIQRRIVNEPLPDPRLRYEYINGNYVDLLNAFTQKDPSMRSSSISKALQRFVRIPQRQVQDHVAPIQSEAVIGDWNPASGYEKHATKVDKNTSGKPISVIHVILVVVALIGISVLIYIVGFHNMNVIPDSSGTNTHAGTSEDTLPAEAATPAVQPDMIYVQGGTYWMGSTNGELDESPVRGITVDPFRISKYEVTQFEWQQIMGSSPSFFEGKDLPVEQVSWYDAIEYCNNRSVSEGLTPCYVGSGNNTRCDWEANGYRLPTEAEWEFAAQGGMKGNGFGYSGANEANSVAWYDNNSGGSTRPVGIKSPNELGVFDMSGNVWEWCWDWYGSYPEYPEYNPRGTDGGSLRVLRGGSWFGPFGLCRIHDRSYRSPGYYHSNVGFRIVRSV